jgi:cytochrome c biogenesis protein CcmG/thiol:disulfide interchange protein DsbE
MRFNILTFAAALAALAFAAPAATAGAAKVGQPAPAFTIRTYAKEKVTLADLRGKVVVINHWATWCGPCKAEMPMMDLFHRRHKQEGFEIFAVATENSVPPKMLKELASVLSFPLALSLRGSGYGPIGNAVPTSYVIDRSGVVRYAKAGAFDKEEFEDIILPLLKEAPPA